MSCWTGARNLYSKGALPGSAHFPIKPLFSLIPTTFYPDSREQREDVKRTASSSKSQQRANFCTCAAPGVVHVTVLRAGSTELQRCTFNSWETAVLKGSDVLPHFCLYRGSGSKSKQSSPPFPHPMLHPQCHWACLSLQTPSSRESLREKGEKAGSTFEPLVPSRAAVIFGCKSALKGQRKLSQLRRIPAISKIYSWFPSRRDMGDLQAQGCDLAEPHCPGKGCMAPGRLAQGL